MNLWPLKSYIADQMIEMHNVLIFLSCCCTFPGENSQQLDSQAGCSVISSMCGDGEAQDHGKPQGISAVFLFALLPQSLSITQRDVSG